MYYDIVDVIYLGEKTLKNVSSMILPAFVHVHSTWFYWHPPYKLCTNTMDLSIDYNNERIYSMEEHLSLPHNDG
jgi:hypothetical protein